MAMLYATIVTVLLNVILIPKYGKEGSALATVIAQVFVPVYLFYKGQKVYSIPYKFAEIVIVIITLLAVAVGIRLLKFNNLALQIFVKTVIAFLMMVPVFFLNRSSINLLLSKIKNCKTSA